MLASAYDAAVRTVNEMDLVRLTAAESRLFANALLTPRKPTEALRRAARRYRGLVAE